MNSHTFAEKLLDKFRLAFLNNYGTKGIIVRFLLSFLIVPLFMPLLMFVEWKHNVNIVKKYENCFRPEVQFD